MTEPAAPTYHRMPRELTLPAGELLRPFGPADLDQLTDIINANIEHLRPWMPWAQAPVTAESQGEFLTRSAADWQEGSDFVWGIFDGPAILGGPTILGGTTILGGIGLHTRRGPGELEIGYWLRADAQGRGIITAGTRLLAEVAASYDEVDQVVICCDEGNARSAAVPQRLGFTLAAVEEREPLAASETGWHQIWTLPTAVIRAGWPA
jgi:RimJ/RimL family protein N-acetyltransferase